MSKLALGLIMAGLYLTAGVEAWAGCAWCPDGCTITGLCGAGGQCPAGHVCQYRETCGTDCVPRQGSCVESLACGQAPKPDDPTPIPTSTPRPRSGTLPTPTVAAGQPTPTPVLADQCSVDCSGQVCADDPNASCSDNSQCIGGMFCGPAGFCRKCTTPGVKCCGYCVPLGWGCSGGCVRVKGYKKAGCKEWNSSTCYSCNSIDGGGDCQWAGEGEVACNGAVGGNACGSATCGVYYSSCYCQVQPTPTPIPKCQVTSLTAVQNCSDNRFNLSWTATNANQATYFTYWYHDGGDFLNDGFTPDKMTPSNTTTATSKVFSGSGGVNFRVCCYNQTDGDHGCYEAGFDMACPLALPFSALRLNLL